MKKISNLTASLLFIILTGCGGSSSSTNNTENLSSQTKEQSPQETNTLKCNRGILLNSAKDNSHSIYRQAQKMTCALQYSN